MGPGLRRDDGEGVAAPSRFSSCSLLNPSLRAQRSNPSCNTMSYRN